jgi:pyruvate dehydrogenase E2 component (dihydrolipoamide acetyltransferase)
MSTFARLMAERTTTSWTSVPHFFVTCDVDATMLNAAREEFAGVSHTDLLVRLVARALAAHPYMNASWIDNTVRMNADINVGIAIAVEDAVVTGVIHHADRMGGEAIAARRKELADRARSRRLQPADIIGATFTISNLGMSRVGAFTAIIVPPQAGILAVGAIADRVVAVDGQPSVRPMVTLTLSADHRVIDGARAVAFLSDLGDAIAAPLLHLK